MVRVGVEEEVDVGGGILLPTYVTGPRSHGWWAMVILLIVIGMIFVVTGAVVIAVQTLTKRFREVAATLGARREQTAALGDGAYTFSEILGGLQFDLFGVLMHKRRAHLLDQPHLARVDALVAELLAFKRRHRGVISNSDWYIAHIPAYLRGELREPCRSGETTIHIDPVGMVRRCPDFPSAGHWSAYRGFAPIACNSCYYACRGEAQAPLTISRFRDLGGSPRPIPETAASSPA